LNEQSGSNNIDQFIQAGGSISNAGNLVLSSGYLTSTNSSYVQNSSVLFDIKGGTLINQGVVTMGSGGFNNINALTVEGTGAATVSGIYFGQATSPWTLYNTGSATNDKGTLITNTSYLTNINGFSWGVYVQNVYTNATNTGGAMYAPSFSHTNIVSNNNTLNLLGTGTLVVNGMISAGAGVKISTNNGTTVSYAGNALNTVNWNGGTLQAGTNSTTFFTNSPYTTVTLGTAGGTFNAAGYNDTISQNLSGPGALTVTNSTGNGTLTLAGSNSFAGVNVTAGGLVAASSNALGSGNASITGGTLQVTASGVANTINANGGTLNFSGSGTSSSAATVVMGGGTLSVESGSGGVNTMTLGTLTLNGGLLNLSYGGGSVDSVTASTLNLSGTTYVNLAGAVAGTYSLLNYGSVTGDVANLSATNLNSRQTVQLMNNSGLSSIQAVVAMATGVWNGMGSTWGTGSDASWNNYNPSLAGDAALFDTTGSSASNITVAPGAVAGSITFSNSDTSYNIGSVTSSNLTLNNGTIASTVTVQAGSHTISEGTAIINGVAFNESAGTALAVAGSITGSGGLRQSGAGSLVLSGSNSYVGVTTVNGGAMVVSNASALSGGALNVVSGVLTNDLYNTVVGAVTLGNGTISGSGTLTGTSFTATNSGDALISQNLAGSGAFTNAGTGTTTLSGTNTYTGTTTVNKGSTLNLTGLLGGGNYTTNLTVNGTLNLASSANQTITTNIGGSNGTILVSGTGVTTLTNQTAYANMTFSNTGTLNLYSTNTTTYTYLNGGVTLNNSGTLNAGNFRFAANAANITNTLNFNGGTATFAGLTVGNASGLSSVNQFTINNGATVTTLGGVNLGFYGGSNTFVINNGGTLIANLGMYLGQAASGSYNALTNYGVYFNTGASVSLNYLFGSNNTSRFVQAGGTFYNSTNMNIGGGAGSTFTGSSNSASLVQVTGGNFSNVGTVTLGYNNNQTTNTFQIDGGTAYVGNLSYGSTYATNQGSTNAVNLNGGTLIVGGTIKSAGINMTNAFNWNGGTLQAGTNSTTFFTNAPNTTVALGSNGGIFDAAGYSVTVSQAIGGGGGLTVTDSTGVGTLTLSGTNSYTGRSIVNSGNLSVTGVLASSGSVLVNSSGTLSGTGSVGNVTVGSGGTIYPGGNNLPGTLTLQSSLWAPGGNYNWVLTDAAGSAGSGYSSLSVSSTLDLSQLSSNNPFNINLSTVGSGGVASNFDPTMNYNWTLLTATDGIFGFSSNDFLINTSGFSNSVRGTFGITTNGNEIDLTYSGIPFQDPFTNGLMVYFPFNDDVIDYSGNGNDLTNFTTGVELGPDRFGTTNRALYLTSGTDFAETVNPLGINGNQSRTISLWVQATGTNPGNLVSLGNSLGVGTALSLLYGDGNISAWGNFADLTAYNQVMPLVSAWHHVVYVYSGSVSGAQIYMDGTPLNGTSVSGNRTDVLNTAAGRLMIGNVNPVYNMPWQPACAGASISDLRVYNRALSFDDVAALYALESGNSSLTNLPQVITFPPVANQTYGVGTLTLNGYVSSGLAVSYGVPSGPAYANNNQLIVTGAGTVTVVATQQGDGNYAPADAVTNSFVVAQANQFITSSQFPDVTYGVGPITFASSAQPSGLPVSYTVLSGPAAISNNVLYLIGAGTITLQESQTGNANYLPASNFMTSFVVNASPQSISFPALGALTYSNRLTTNLIASSSSRLTVSFSSPDTNVVAISNSVATIVGAGTATIVAMQGGNSNYLAAIPVTNTLVIGKGVASVTISGTNWTYDGTAKGVRVVTMPTNLAVAVTYNGATNLPIGGGSYAVTASVVDSNYVGSNSATMLIAQATPSFAIQTNNLSNTYTGDFWPVLVSGAGSVPYQITYNGSTNVPRNAGIYTVVATSTDTNDYTAYAVTNTLVIRKAGASLSITNLNQTFDGSFKGVQVTTIPGGVSCVTLYNGQSNLPLHAGTYAVSSTVSDPNYAGSATGTLVVGKGVSIINPFSPIPDQTFSNGLTLSVPSPSTSSGVPSVLSVVSGPAILTNSLLLVTGPGYVTIAADQPGNQDVYPAQRVVTSFNVSRVPQTISSIPVMTDMVYGSLPQSLPSVRSSGGLPVTWSVRSGPAEINNGLLTLTGTGPVTLALNCGGTSLYLPAPEVSATFNSISPAAGRQVQVLSFGNLQAKNFGVAPYTLAAWTRSHLPVSFYSSDTNVATISGNTVTITGAGVAKITAYQPGDETWQPATPVSQLLVVNGTQEKIIFNSIGNVPFGTPAFAPRATVSSKLPITFTSSDPTVAIITNGMILPTGVGQVLITATQPGQGGYLAAAPVSQALTVLPGHQSLTFPTLGSCVYGVTPIVLGATSSAGLPVSYASSNTNVAAVSGNLLLITGAGTTKISAIQAGNAYWGAAYSQGQIFTVTKASQSIAFTLPSTVAYRPGGIIPLGGTATSALPLTYKSSNTKVLSVSGGTAAIQGRGTVTITASQSGNSNYNAAAQVPVTISVQ
jgi:MBG domain/Passenger-associated-transport-repeat